ncbi:VCBS repeat-containing protein [Streptomyces thermoalcalitolerans]|uniref:VCBS repeat-containing protein n=1 Tax=Streptomyces thermoalcalitolerans TaxID=65605 RepID=A0ABN1NIA3_9ACTN
MGERWRHTAAAVLTAALLAWGLGPGGTSATAAVACPSGVESDFNGDGIRDTAISDPEASDQGVPRAGAVHVVYGGGKGTLTLVQSMPDVPGVPESGDRYGYALAIYDADLDGCSDLVVGNPFEDIGTEADSGSVHVFYGSPSGLNAGGRAAKEFYQGSGKPLGGSAEAGDWVGYALAAGKTSTGTPYLIIGVPGESIGTVEDAGGFCYVHGTGQTVVCVNQDTETGGAVPGVAEQDDRLGSSIAATPTHFAVGGPGEAIGSTTFAGMVNLFSHTLSSGRPKPLTGLSQDTDGVTGGTEVDDQFGAALAMVPYRPPGATSTTESLLAVGVPGEDLSTTVDAGAVLIFRITAAGTVTETAWADQNTTDVEGEAEAGDFFGQRLAAVNTSPNTTSTATTTRLAIGVPGEESSEEHADKGGVQIVPMVGAPGASDVWIDPGYGVPSEPAPRMFTGLSLSALSTQLYVGVSYGPAGGHAVYAFPWTVASGEAPIRTWKPGEGGIPAGDVAFGAAVG